MAQTVDEIAEILNDMRNESNHNSENVEKVLTGINSKLELISEDDEMIELVKFYISELKKNIEDKHSTFSNMFNEIQDSFENIALSQKELAKTQKVEELFASCNSYITSFASGLSEQKTILEDLIQRLTYLSDNTAEKTEVNSLIHELTAEIIRANKAFTDRFDIFEKDFGHLVKDSDFSSFRGDLADFIQKIIDNCSALNSELTFSNNKIEDILSAVKSINFKEDFENVINKIDDIRNSLNEDAKANYENLSFEVSQLSENLNDGLISIGNENQNTCNELKKELVEILESLKKLADISYQNSFDELLTVTSQIVSDVNLVKDSMALDIKENSDSNYQALKNYIEELTDNVSLLKSEFSDVSNRNYERSISDIAAISTELSVLRDEFNQAARADFENSSKILEKVNVVSDNLEGIAGSVDEIRASFENNSKMNYDNLVNQINSLKNDINDNLRNKKEFDNLSSLLAEIIININNIKDIYVNNAAEVVDNVSKGQAVLQENITKFNENSEMNFGSLKSVVEQITEEINNIKSDILVKNDKNIFNILSGFDTVKMSLENILIAFNSLNESFENVSGKNSDKVIGAIADIVPAIDELRSDIQQISCKYVDKIMSTYNEISVRLDEISDKSYLDEQFSELKNSILSTISQIDIEQYIHHADENNESQMAQIRLVSEDINNIKLHIDDAAMSIQKYIDEFKEVSEVISAEGNDKITSKLFDLESIIEHGSDDFKQNIESLQAKIVEFAHIVENSNSDTEGKIASSLEEIASIKVQLIEISESFKSKMCADEKLADSFNLIESGIENVLLNINNISESIGKDVDSSIKENVSVIDEKFENICENIKTLTDTNALSNENIISELETKINALKTELGMISADIINVQIAKNEELIEAFQPVKFGIDHLIGLDFCRIISDVKSQLETSFEKVNTDLSGELVQTSQSLGKLEQVYKDTYNKLSDLQECVSDKIQNNIELLNVTLETGIKEIKSGFQGKLEEHIGELKNYLEFSFDNAELKNSVDELKTNLINKLSAFAGENEGLTSSISVLGNNIQDYIKAVSVSIESKSDITNDILENLQNKIEVVDGKLDVIVSDTSISEINERFDELEQNSEKYSDILSSIDNRIDTLINKDDTKNLLEINENFDKLSEDNTKVKDMLSTLHSKVDTIIFDDGQEDLLKEIKYGVQDFSSVKENISEMLLTLHEKIDALVTADTDFEILEDISNSLDSFSSRNEDISDKLSALHEKIDIIITEDSQSDMLREISDNINNSISTDEKITDILSALNTKVDLLAESSTDANIMEEIDEIKSIIFEQRKFFEESSDEKTAAIDKYLRDVLLKLDNVDLEKNSEDIKESILQAIVSLVEQISFVEESEDIKDFVEEKTGELKQNLKEVQNQLKLLSSSNDDFEYTYTLQDVESDIAKLRLAINNMPENDFSDITEEVQKITDAVNKLESSLTHDEIVDLKSDIEKLNEDIVSISSRTNKLILNSDESYKALNEGLNNFSNIIFKLDERINYLDNTEITERLENKVDKIQSVVNSCANFNKVSNQVLGYFGEWIDNAGENIIQISDKLNEIDSVKESIQEIKELLPEKESVLNDICSRFERQEQRIDSLETKLEKIISAFDDDIMLNRKVDKIEKMLSVLGANIEKLTSYVDE